MTRTDWRIAAVVVALWALAVALSACASSVADFLGTARQAHAFHMVSVGLLMGGPVLALCILGIAGVVARPRTPKLRGDIRAWAGDRPVPGARSRVSPRFNDGR